MRTLILFIIGLLFVSGSLASCGTSVTAPSDVATAKSYFYPFDYGLLYTYSRYANNHYDTIVCGMVIGGNSSEKNTLVISKTNVTLYDMSIQQDASGNQAAVLQRGDTSLLVLDGVLEPTATWIADGTHGIQATVVDRYDDYYLPGRKVHFSDVLAVKYHTIGQPDNVYTLRFFARDHGLILEQQLVGSNTELASLQLLGIQYPSHERRQERGPDSRLIRTFEAEPMLLQALDTSMTQ